jgi:hypothetical protein
MRFEIVYIVAIQSFPIFATSLCINVIFRFYTYLKAFTLATYAIMRFEIIYNVAIQSFPIFATSLCIIVNFRFYTYLKELP